MVHQLGLAPGPADEERAEDEIAGQETGDEGRRPGPDTPIEVNLASVDELWELPGIGRRLSARIVESRIMEGPFASVSDLLAFPASLPGFSPGSPPAS